MKKLLVMVMLLCSMCAVCFAKLEQPIDDRWVIIGGEKGDFEIWMDVDTIKWKKSGEIGHSNHKAARIWMRTLNYKDSYDSLFCYEYDFDCSSNRFVNSSIRDDKGKILESISREEFVSEPITPGSGFEAVYHVLLFIDQYRDSQKDYEFCINFMKNATDKYKNGEFEK